MDVRCREALKTMNFGDVQNVIECFERNKIDYEALLLLKEFPENISSILSGLSDQLRLRKGLQSLVTEPQPRISLSYDAPSTSSSSSVSCSPNSITGDDLTSLLSSNPSSPSVVMIDADTLMFSPESSTPLLENNLSPPLSKRPRVENSAAKVIDQRGEKSSTQQQISPSTYISDVLNKSIAGQLVLAVYKKRGLDSTSRCRLAELVVTAEYKDCSTQIAGSRFSELARQIVDTFPGESVETYYISSSARGKGRSASGKLYDFYTNTNRELRKAGLRDLHTGTSSEKIGNSGNNPKVIIRPSDGDIVTQRALDFLETYLEPWHLVEENWKITAGARLFALRDPDNSEFRMTHDYISKYGVLKQPAGHLLLEYDFEVLFPDAKDRMESHWDTFAEKLKQAYAAVGINDIEGDTPLLFNFPRLFSVVSVKVPGNKPWRASRSDIQGGFLVHLKAIGELEKRVEELRKTAQLRGTHLQPFPVIVGEDLNHITSSYLILEDKRIRVEDPKRAVEITFKAYHALYCSYPVQSERLWMVFQKALFCINEAADSNVKSAPDVLRLISVLKV